MKKNTVQPRRNFVSASQNSPLRGIATLVTWLSAFCFAAAASADTTRLLGSTLLTKRENDVDVLKFEPCRRDVDSVQLKVRRGNVEIEKVWFRFANGERAEISVRDRFGKGGNSRWIDLPRGERCVVSIGVIGDTENSRKQARVSIYAR